MSAPSDAQLGFAEQTALGVPKAPTLFLPLLEPEITDTLDALESEAVIAGLDIVGTEQRNGGARTVEVAVGGELYQNSMGLLMRHCLGGYSSSGAGPYTHTFTPGDIDALPALCTQLGLPRVAGGGVDPWTAVDCRVTDWEIACSAGEIATFGVNMAATCSWLGSRQVTDGATTSTSTTLTSASAAFAAEDVGQLVTGTGIPTGTTIVSITSSTSVVLSAAATATAAGVTVRIGLALGTPTYATSASKPFKFIHASATIDGADVPFEGITISGDNALKTDRRPANRGGLASIAAREGRRAYTAKISKEYLDPVHWNRVRRGGDFPLVVTLASGASSVAITGNVRYDAANPKTDGKSLAEEEIELVFLRSGSTNASAISVAIVDGTTTYA